MKILNPKIEKTKLQNGCEVLSVIDKNIPYSAIGFWYTVGARQDPKDKIGLAHFFEHIFVGKTKQFPDKSERFIMLDSKGIEFNASTSFASTHYYQTQLHKNSLDSLALLTDAVTNPLIDEIDVEYEKEIIVNEEKDSRSNPSDYIWRLRYQALWPESSLSTGFFGTETTIQSIKLDDILDFKKKFYQPQNCSVIIVSNGNTDKHVDLLESTFKTDNKSEVPERKKEIFTKKPIPLLIEKRVNDLIEVSIAFRTCPQENTRDLLALDILSDYLVGNFSSKLVQRMRIKENLTYWVYGSTASFHDTGDITIDFSIEKEKLQKSIDIINEEISKLQNQKVSKKDLETTKTIYLTNSIQNLSRPFQMLQFYGHTLVNKAPFFDLQEYIDELSLITADDILRVSQKYLKKENRSIVLIGDISEEEIRL